MSRTDSKVTQFEIFGDDALKQPFTDVPRCIHLAELAKQIGLGLEIRAMDRERSSRSLRRVKGGLGRLAASACVRLALHNPRAAEDCGLRSTGRPFTQGRLVMTATAREFHDGSVHHMVVDHRGKVLVDEEFRGE